MARLQQELQINVYNHLMIFNKNDLKGTFSHFHSITFMHSTYKFHQNLHVQYDKERTSRNTKL